MPDTRPADYYLGYLDGSVFLDFNNQMDRICLARISFDGFGCCELGEKAIPLDQADSKVFKALVRDGITDQDLTEKIVKRAIALNKSLIWTDALEEYQLA